MENEDLKNFIDRVKASYVMWEEKKGLFTKKNEKNELSNLLEACDRLIKERQLLETIYWNIIIYVKRTQGVKESTDTKIYDQIDKLNKELYNNIKKIKTLIDKKSIFTEEFYSDFRKSRYYDRSEKIRTVYHTTIDDKLSDIIDFCESNDINPKFEYENNISRDKAIKRKRDYVSSFAYTEEINVKNGVLNQNGYTEFDEYFNNRIQATCDKEKNSYDSIKLIDGLEQIGKKYEKYIENPISYCHYLGTEGFKAPFAIEQEKLRTLCENAVGIRKYIDLLEYIKEQLQSEHTYYYSNIIENCDMEIQNLREELVKIDNQIKEELAKEDNQSIQSISSEYNKQSKSTTAQDKNNDDVSTYFKDDNKTIKDGTPTVSADAKVNIEQQDNIKALVIGSEIYEFRFYDDEIFDGRRKVITLSMKEAREQLVYQHTELYGKFCDIIYDKRRDEEIKEELHIKREPTDEERKKYFLQKKSEILSTPYGKILCKYYNEIIASSDFLIEMEKMVYGHKFSTEDLTKELDIMKCEAEHDEIKSMKYSRADRVAINNFSNILWIKRKLKDEVLSNFLIEEVYENFGLKGNIKYRNEDISKEDSILECEPETQVTGQELGQEVKEELKPQNEPKRKGLLSRLFSIEKDKPNKENDSIEQ